MEKNTTIYTALAILLTLASCAREDSADVSLPQDGNRIYFRSYLPAINETRAGVMSKENLMECRVTCFNPEDTNLINSQTAELEPYFIDMRFEKQADGLFLGEDPSSAIWPNSKHRLHFFAYYPSVEWMQLNIAPGNFKLVNSSNAASDTPVIDYRLENFKIAPDIADQIDFITAYSAATKQGDGAIDLSFTHQLARIELSAWGASENYDFEIAGVRIGNPITQGDFNFSSLTPSSAAALPWIKTEGKQAPVEHIFGPGESIVVLSKERGLHAAQNDAASVMGNAGPAMVIPMSEKIEAWEGKADPEINAVKYSTDKLYFSLLLRVINRHNEIAYPYPNNNNFIPVTYLAVRKDDRTVVRRVYKIDEEYYTTDKKNDEYKYVPSDSEEILDFCWASLPVKGGAKWEAGKIYAYKLNYTNGIGWQDPSDPTPGDPIIERGMVPFEVNVAEWVEAEDHDPNLDVPKR